MGKFDLELEIIHEDVQASSTSSNITRLNPVKSRAQAGFQKTIIKWLKAFMTLKGSDPVDPEYGTAFPGLIGANISSRRDVRFVVQNSVENATDIVIENQREDLPEDDSELLEEAELESVIFEEGGTALEVRVRLTNIEGEVLRLQVPKLRLL